MCVHLNMCVTLLQSCAFPFQRCCKCYSIFCKAVCVCVCMRSTHACTHLSVSAKVIMCKLCECMCVVGWGEGGIFFKYRGVDNYGLNECSQSASLSVCKKRKAQLKPLQGRLITPRKRGNINGRFCGYNVTAKWLHQPQHVKRSHSYFWRLRAALHRCVRFIHMCRIC